MGFWSKWFGGGSPEGRSALAEKQTTAEALLQRALGNDPADTSLGARRKAAIRLVLANQTAKGREAWHAIAREFPGELADALEQVGVCYHLDKDYRAALENYEAAIRVGADASMLADNIAEACKGLAALG